MCRSTAQGGRRCSGSRSHSPAPTAPAGTAFTPTPTPAPSSAPAGAAGGVSGTGGDWRNAQGPAGTRPVGPKTTDVRDWDSIPSRGPNSVATDRELLAMWDRTARENEHLGNGQWANALNRARELRERAANGYHDGSLPELGDYRPVYFVPVDPS